MNTLTIGTNRMSGYWVRQAGVVIAIFDTADEANAFKDGYEHGQLDPVVAVQGANAMSAEEIRSDKANGRKQG